MNPYDYGYSYGHEAGLGILGFVGHAVGTVLLIILILWVVRRFVFGREGGKGFRNFRGRWAMHSGLQILNERYAKGEIEKAEYEERKQTLLDE